MHGGRFTLKQAFISVNLYSELYVQFNWSVNSFHEEEILTVEYTRVYTVHFTEYKEWVLKMILVYCSHKQQVNLRLISV